MARPSFQFYPKDYRGHAKLRFCSWAARGAWVEFLCLAHDSDEYGVLREPLKSIAEAMGAPLKLLRELSEKGVLYGTEKGPCEPMVYRAKSGRKIGPPVTLIAAQNGPIWYSPRMVKDEYLRQIRGGTGVDTTDIYHPPKASPLGGLGEVKDAASSCGKDAAQGVSPLISSSSSSSSSKEQEQRALEAAIALRALGMLDVTPTRAELHTLIAAGATLAQLTDAAEELTAKKKGAPPSLPYLAATLLGRAADLQRGTHHGSTATTGGRASPKSATARAEAARRAGDARDDANATVDDANNADG